MKPKICEAKPKQHTIKSVMAKSILEIQKQCTMYGGLLRQQITTKATIVSGRLVLNGYQSMSIIMPHALRLSPSLNVVVPQ